LTYFIGGVINRCYNTKVFIKPYFYKTLNIIIPLIPNEIYYGSLV